MPLKNLQCFFILLLSAASFSQNSFHRISAYVGIMHPIATINRDETMVNFRDYYAVGFPVGINLWKSEKIGFSFEVVPNIKDDQGSSKVTNLLFHPGILAALGKGYTFAGRAAFESSGRYGFTPVLSKTLLKSPNCSYFLALPLPVRFGNGHPASFTAGFQFGISF